MRRFDITWTHGLIAAAVLPAAALVFALIAQYGYDYLPCKLCMWQRLPYALCVLAAAAGFVPRLAKWRGAVLLLCALLLIADMGIAFFHVGVERHWWGGGSGCSFDMPQTAITSIADLRETLLSVPVVRCDAVGWEFLGMSMAFWNILYALFAAPAVLYTAFFGRPDGEKAL